MTSARHTLLAGVVLVAATLAAYWPSFEAPFLFDDNPAVVNNESIRQLWPLGPVLSPPNDGSGTTGRPMVNLSLAVNYALGGLDVRGYHAMNLLLHLLTVLALWGILRRTLRLPPVATTPGGKLLAENAELTAFTAALLWAVHPLLTESVVCVVQRTEVLGGLFYLLTFYAFIRAATATTAVRRWQVLAVAACLLGVGSKEIVATAPLLAWLYDRTFVAGTFAAAWRQRKWLYGALATTWLPLAWLMTHNMQRGGTVGFGLGMSSWTYLLTQCEALTIYLKLSVWPHPLIVDYGLVVAGGLGEVWGRGLLIVALLVATGLALHRKPALGFLGVWFFVILAPSSSIVPLTTQTIAEHRMYLPLVAVLVLLVGGGVAWFGRRALVVFLALAVGAVGLTVQRTQDYRSEMSLWQDTVNHSRNARALSSLGSAHYHQGNYPEAVRLFKESIRLDPDKAQTHFNLGLAQMVLQHTEAAAASFTTAVSILPYYAQAHAELGSVLFKLGRLEEAEQHLRTALSYLPDRSAPLYTLGLIFAQQGRTPEALAAYARALQIDPGLTDAHYNYGIELAKTGRTTEAMAQYREAIRQLDTHAEARINLGILLAQADRLPEALEQLQEAVRLRPDLAEAQANLGIALALAGRPAEALGCYARALQLRPDHALTHYNRGNALVDLQRWGEARREFAEAVRLDPGLTMAREMWERLQAAPAGP